MGTESMMRPHLPRPALVIPTGVALLLLASVVERSCPYGLAEFSRPTPKERERLHGANQEITPRIDLRQLPA